jgi:hypothetical protein
MATRPGGNERLAAAGFDEPGYRGATALCGFGFDSTFSSA